jgi:hypothetical protein
MDQQYTIFEYLYRDAGNYKSWGRLLLAGRISQGYSETLISHLQTDNLFVAEQVSIPPLYKALWALSGGKTEDDHAFHEFFELRPATSDEMGELAVFTDTDELLSRFRQVGHRWDCLLSPNCTW